MSAKPKPKPEVPVLGVYDVTTKVFVEVPLYSRGLETVGWLLGRVEQEIQKQLQNAGRISSSTQRVDVGGKIFVGWSTIGNQSWECSLDRYLLLGDLWTVKTRTIRDCIREHGTGQVFVRIGATSIAVGVEGHHKISRIMDEIEGRGILAREDYYLMSGTKILRESSTIAQSNIANGTTIFLRERLRGGAKSGVKFVDISKESKRREWSERAPKWRKTASGLCIEGVCKNKKCEAHKKRVVMNQGFVECFNIIEDAYQCKCPICKECVEPIACGFNNCKWYWVGKKRPSHSERPVVERGEVQTADNAYHYFDPSTAGTASWLMLNIYTIDPAVFDMENMCSICHDSMSTTERAQSLRCGHQFHQRCIQNWRKYCHRGRVNSLCPLCRADDSSNQRAPGHRSLSPQR